MTLGFIQHLTEMSTGNVSEDKRRPVRKANNICGSTVWEMLDPAKLVPTFADRGCRTVNATDPHSR
jgi:hypothetical protein